MAIPQLILDTLEAASPQEIKEIEQHCNLLQPPKTPPKTKYSPQLLPEHRTPQVFRAYLIKTMGLIVPRGKCL